LFGHYNKEENERWFCIIMPRPCPSLEDQYPRALLLSRSGFKMFENED
jgi:hypothetical protein